MIGKGGAVVLVALALAPAAPADGFAQGINFSQKSDVPIEVEADQDIEWLRDQQVYVARGNARATRADVTVYGDTLTAHYRETAWADRAIYDADQSVIVLLGHNLKLVTKTDVLTARDSLEYWDKRQLAVARGDALAVRDDRRIRADTLSAQFVGVAGQGQKLQRVDAFGNVEVSTQLEVARGEKGVYLADREVSTLIGNVRITRGQNQLNGDVGEVDMKTGISRLLNAGTGQARVRGLFVPEHGQSPASGKKP